jgi:hypothetical protein
MMQVEATTNLLFLPTNMRIGGYDFFILDEYNKVSLES